jgi:hypothetical protein
MLELMGKQKLLTVRFSEEMIAEYNAAAEIHRARSGSEHLHRFVVSTIEEARNKVTHKEWESLVKQKLTDLRLRGKEKLQQRQMSLNAKPTPSVTPLHIPIRTAKAHQEEPLRKQKKG